MRGAINELEIVSFLMTAGFVVCRNLAPTGIYDMVAASNDGSEVYLIDAKTHASDAMLKDAPPQVSIIHRTNDDDFEWVRKVNVSWLPPDGD